MTPVNALRDTANNHIPQMITPYKTDYPFRIVSLVAKGNPLRTGMIYFLVSYGVINIIGLFTGELAGANGLRPLYSYILDNVNVGILAPVGAGLLCHLYNSIANTFSQLMDEGIVPDEAAEDFTRLVHRLEALYNNIWFSIGAMAISLGLNVQAYLLKADSYFTIQGGLSGAYGRVFISINYYVIALILWKSLVTVWGLQRVLKMDIKIRPLHPDRAGGLKAIGRLSIAINYFWGLIVLFSTLMLIFEDDAHQLHYYLIFGLMYFLQPFLLVTSVAKANRKMAQNRKHALQRLGLTFDYYYAKLSRGQPNTPYDLEAAEEISKIHDLYGIVNSMPVWPFDIQTLTRFSSVIILPVIVFILGQLVSTDSVVFVYFKDWFCHFLGIGC